LKSRSQPTGFDSCFFRGFFFLKIIKRDPSQNKWLKMESVVLVQEQLKLTA